MRGRKVCRLFAQTKSKKDPCLPPLQAADDRARAKLPNYFLGEPRGRGVGDAAILSQLAVLGRSRPLEQLREALLEHFTRQRPRIKELGLAQETAARLGLA